MARAYVFNPFTGKFDAIDVYGVPTYIASAALFDVPANTQALTAAYVQVDGYLQLEGELIEVL